MVGLQQVEQAVEEVDEVDADDLEGRLPLSVPVRVGDDGHPTPAHAARLGARTS